MLLSLQVKNLALIEEAEISLSNGLNIITGETGAGKSIMIGAVNLALGKKVNSDIIQAGKEYAYVELVFLVDEKKIKALKLIDVYADEFNQVIISRKIFQGRNVCKINNETVTVSFVKQVTSILIDIHGQHEHQSLLYKSKHMEIIDRYAEAQISQIKDRVLKSYEEYKAFEKLLKSFSDDESERQRKKDFLSFEINEIEQANIKPDEERELEVLYKRIGNKRKIASALSLVHTGLAESNENILYNLGKFIKELLEITNYDEDIVEIKKQLEDSEAILSGVSYEISSYIDNLEVNEELVFETEKRLDLIRSIFLKYGQGHDILTNVLEDKKKELDILINYEERKKETLGQFELIKQKLEVICEELSLKRKEAAVKLCEEIEHGLTELNFVNVELGYSYNKLNTPTNNGFDDIEFVISTNSGEVKKPLAQIASGGELSRIMLAIKTVLAEGDNIPSLIFDEIDTGISGRTAQKVAEKLVIISKFRQVICITHLPQIAAMADAHFVIEKAVIENGTRTQVNKLNETDSISELARLMGGASITDALLGHAKEMKVMADNTKIQLRK
jgi:DNA repair protein RecN